MDDNQTLSMHTMNIDFKLNSNPSQWKVQESQVKQDFVDILESEIRRLTKRVADLEKKIIIKDDKIR